MVYLIRNEYIKFKNKKAIYIFLLIEVAIYGFYALFDSDIFSNIENTAYVMEQYYGLVMLLNCIFMTIVVINGFSDEFKNGEMVVSITSPHSRIKVLIAKIVSIEIAVSIVYFFNVILNSIIHIAYNLNNPILGNLIKDMIKYELINILPIIAFSFFIVLINLIIEDTALTMFCMIIMLVLPEAVPSFFSKYVISYYINYAVKLDFVPGNNLLQYGVSMLVHILTCTGLACYVFNRKEF